MLNKAHIYLHKSKLHATWKNYLKTAPIKLQ